MRCWDIKSAGGLKGKTKENGAQTDGTPGTPDNITKDQEEESIET